MNRPSVDFDHHSPEYAADWPRITHDARGKCPVAWTEAHGGYWVVTGYEEISGITRQPDRFRNGRRDDKSSTFVPSTPEPLYPLELDDPMHAQIRRTLNPHFSPRMAAAWRPFVEQTTDTMIDKVIGSGKADLVADITKPVPAVLNLSLLGIPVDDLQSLYEYLDAPGVVVRSKPGSPEYERALQVIRDSRAQTEQIIQDRRARPQNDLATVIAGMEFDGQPADVDFLSHLIQDVVSGGNGTTTALVSHSLLWLGAHQQARTAIIQGTASLDTATEEFLRAFPPASNLARSANGDFEYVGQDIKDGEVLVLCTAAANRDERVFTAPDEVQIDRHPNPHMTFGSGHHKCLGSHLARMAGRVIIERVLARIPDYEVDFGAVEKYQAIPVVNGVLSIPATFTPGEPVGARIPERKPPLPKI